MESTTSEDAEIVADELEALEAIFSTELEVRRTPEQVVEYVVNVACSRYHARLHAVLCVGYPSSAPPLISIEAPTTVLSEDRIRQLSEEFTQTWVDSKGG